MPIAEILPHTKSMWCVLEEPVVEARLPTLYAELPYPVEPSMREHQTQVTSCNAPRAQRCPDCEDCRSLIRIRDCIYTCLQTDEEL
jgi:hypothetical protein